MPDLKINDLPNTQTLEDLDSFEVSRHNSGNRTSAHVNYGTLRDAAENDLINLNANNKGVRFHPNSFGIGAYATGAAASYFIPMDKTSSRTKYSTIEIDLSNFASIPDNATHALINAYYVCTGNANIYSHYVFGIDHSENEATGIIQNFDNHLGALPGDSDWSEPATQQYIANTFAKCIGTCQTNVPSNLVQAQVFGDLAVPINNPTKKIKLVIAVTQASGANWVVPSMGNVTYQMLVPSCRGWYV